MDFDLSDLPEITFEKAFPDIGVVEDQAHRCPFFEIDYDEFNFEDAVKVPSDEESDSSNEEDDRVC